MKLSHHDRLQAIARNLIFIKLREELKTSSQQEAVQKMEQIQEDFDLTMDELKFTLRVSLNLSKRKRKTPASRPSVTAFSSSEKNNIVSCILNQNPIHATIGDTLRAELILQEMLDKRFLLVKIDPVANEEDITRELKVALKKHLKTSHPKMKKGKDRKTKVDPWLVYDLAKKKNLLQITKELFKITEHPAYDDEAKKLYNRVQRAYKKAQKMIEQVTPSKYKTS